MATRWPQPGNLSLAPKAKLIDAPIETVSAQDRENPGKLTGEALRLLAHRRGMAKSSLADMSDTKIREQLNMIAHRQYDDAVE